jgi:hypothetical protein
VQRPGRGLEPRFYVDDDVFVRERVFAGSWMPVCRTEDVGDPVNTQDIVPNTGVFAGLRSRYAVPATLLPPEAAVDHVTHWYLDRMSA